MKSTLWFTLTLLVSPLFITSAQSVPSGKAKTVIAIHVEKPDFVFWGGKTIFSGAKFVPLADFDFERLFADELLAQFSQDKRMEWRLAVAQDGVDAQKLWNGKAKAPEGLTADRFLLGSFYGYGALSNLSFGMKDKYYIQGDVRLLDRKTGKRLWSASSGEPLKHLSNVHLVSNEKLAKVPAADQQKVLKEGTNRMIELFAKKRSEQLMAKNPL